MVTDQQTDRLIDIVTYRAAIAAKNIHKTLEFSTEGGIPPNLLILYQKIKTSQTDPNAIFFSQIGAETAKTLENILKFREEYLNQ